MRRGLDPDNLRLQMATRPDNQGTFTDWGKTMNMRKLGFGRLALSAAAILIAVPSAIAGTVTQATFQSDFGLSGLGAFEGTIAYDTNDDTTGLLTISLTNLSDNGGFLTGFLFNVNGNATATYVPIANDNFSNAGGNGSPFGQFEAGAALGGNFQGGGNPNIGIAPGASRTFQFHVAGAVSSLTANSFFSELSTGAGAGEGYQYFIARFRGFDDGGSDKVVGGKLVVVPTPSAALGGLVLLGGSMLRRRHA